MEIKPELWVGALYGAILLLMAVGKFLESYHKPAPKTDPVIAGIAMGFGDKEQLNQITRIADALEQLAELQSSRQAEDVRELRREVRDALHRRGS